MLVKADLVWGALAAEGRVGISGTLSPGKKPPRQRQSVALPRPRNKFARCNPLQRAPRRLTEILLQPGRMNFFSIRGRLQDRVASIQQSDWQNERGRAASRRGGPSPYRP